MLLKRHLGSSRLGACSGMSSASAGFLRYVSRDVFRYFSENQCAWRITLFQVEAVWLNDK